MDFQIIPAKRYFNGQNVSDFFLVSLPMSIRSNTYSIKYDRSQRGGRIDTLQSLLVTVMPFYLVTVTSFCGQMGDGVKKGQKIAVILNL